MARLLNTLAVGVASRIVEITNHPGHGRVMSNSEVNC